MVVCQAMHGAKWGDWEYRVGTMVQSNPKFVWLSGISKINIKHPHGHGKIGARDCQFLSVWADDLEGDCEKSNSQGKSFLGLFYFIFTSVKFYMEFTWYQLDIKGNLLQLTFYDKC